jgi:hypothetical protein
MVGPFQHRTGIELGPVSASGGSTQSTMRPEGLKLFPPAEGTEKPLIGIDILKIPRRKSTHYLVRAKDLATWKLLTFWISIGENTSSIFFELRYSSIFFHFCWFFVLGCQVRSPRRTQVAGEKHNKAPEICNDSQSTCGILLNRTEKRGWTFDDT